MKKLLFSLLAIIVCLSFATGCDNKNVTSNNISSVDEFSQEVKELGINYVETEMAGSYIGAESGIKLTADNKKLEIYKYNTSTEEYKNAEANQKITITGIGSYDAIVKNGYALLIDEDYPQYDSIIELFNKLK